jgi:uncharacterized protein (DUF1778 family)
LCRPDKWRTFSAEFLQAVAMTTPTSDSVETNRSARLEARISATQKNVLQRAAALSGRTLSEFVVASAQEAATRVIREHDSIVLSRAEQTAFVKALLAPPAPGGALRKAAAAYKKRRAR